MTGCTCYEAQRMKSSIILTIAAQLDEVALAGASQNYDLYSMCVIVFVHSLLSLFSIL